MSAKYSDEIINAYIDGELGAAEKQGFRLDMERDDELAARVDALCHLKKSLQASYQQLPVVSRQVVQSSGKSWAQSVAALLLLVVGVLAGWLGHGNYSHEKSILANAKQNTALEGVQLTPVNFSRANKIILHLSNDQDDRLRKTLEKVEMIIAKYKENGLPYQVEVIANAGGINLLRDDVSPYKKRIGNILNAYDNVSFIACSNALERLRLQGIEPHLIKRTKTGVTAVEQIIKRLQQGWVYMKV